MKDPQTYLQKRYVEFKDDITEFKKVMLDNYFSSPPNYFNSGLEMGLIAKDMGLYPTQTPSLEADVKRDDDAPGQFLAGWAYGISTHAVDIRNLLIGTPWTTPPVEGCFKRNPDLTDNVYDGMAALEAKDSVTAA